MIEDGGQWQKCLVTPRLQPKLTPFHGMCQNPQKNDPCLHALTIIVSLGPVALKQISSNKIVNTQQL